MDKLQWFKFSPSDWMMGRIQRCDLDTQALFLRLCCIYWNKQCKLSKDDAIFEIDQKHFDILVSKKIIFCNDTNISISFLDEQFMEINEEKQDKSKSGVIGNLKRWHRPIFDSYERKEISLEDAIILSKNNSNAIAEQSHPDSNAIAEQSQIIAEKNREDKEQIRKENKKNSFLLEKETKNNICDIYDFEVLETEEIKKEKSSAKKDKENKPDLSEFLEYAEQIIIENKLGSIIEYKLAIEAKFEQWSNNNWKDGHGKPIKRWKPKLKTAFQYFKPIKQQNYGNTETRTESKFIGRMSEETVKRNLQGW